MKVRNVHERVLDAPGNRVGELLDSLASPDDALWPHDVWPPMKLDRPLQVGAAGGHGPIRYSVEAYERGRFVRFRFSAPRGFNGTHGLRVMPLDGGRTRLRHVLEMRTTGLAVLSWPIVFRPLHDALLEDALDRAERRVGGTPAPRRWSWQVRALRRMLARRRVGPARPGQQNRGRSRSLRESREARDRSRSNGTGDPASDASGEPRGVPSSRAESAGAGPLFFEGLPGHLALVVVLLAGVYAAGRAGVYDQGSFLRVSTATWVWIAVVEAVAHQVYVWWCWRAELHAGLLTRVLGGAAFRVYAAGFAVLILARPVLVTAVALSNRGTVPVPPLAAYSLAALLAVPVVYLLHSIRRYFGFVRAFGIDHFDPSYRSTPLVRRGIFRLTPNAMYVFGFFALWIPAIALRSGAALVVALFSHLYIWAHYLFTERPDMKRIYGAPRV